MQYISGGLDALVWCRYTFDLDWQQYQVIVPVSPIHLFSKAFVLYRAGGLESSQHALGNSRGTPWTGRQSITGLTHRQTTTFTPAGSLVFAVHLTCKSLDCRRKLNTETLQPAGWGSHAPPFLLWNNSVNCWATSPPTQSVPRIWNTLLNMCQHMLHLTEFNLVVNAQQRSLFLQHEVSQFDTKVICELHVSGEINHLKL